MDAYLMGRFHRPGGAIHLNALSPITGFSLLAVIIAGKAQQAVYQHMKATTHT